MSSVVIAASGARPKRRPRLGAIVLATGIIIGGLSFCFKIVEFIFTLDSPEAPGFAVVPVVTYFIVAAGYLFLFLWSYTTGQFANLEAPKEDFFRREAELERLESKQ
jgi:nitrogen fixation-related uncharacterized protein